MKYLKTFESYGSEMSREEMCNYLCNCGYEMAELETCPNEELMMMCKVCMAEETNETNETHSYETEMSREEMCNYLCSCGYEMAELETCPNEELMMICRVCREEEETNEAKGDKWIQDAIKRPGALRKKMKKGESEKISMEEIADELSDLKKKDKDKEKPGLQLSATDRRKQKQLVLARTLKNLK